MLAIRSKKGQIRCRNGQSILITKAAALRVTDCTSAGVRLRFTAVDLDCPRTKTPVGGQYVFRKGQRFLVARGMVLRVIECKNGSARLDFQAAVDGDVPWDSNLGNRPLVTASDDSRGGVR